MSTPGRFHAWDPELQAWVGPYMAPLVDLGRTAPPTVWAADQVPDDDEDSPGVTP